MYGVWGVYVKRFDQVVYALRASTDTENVFPLTKN